eukprot:TRINITY_DN29289_c0_g1_i1.p1 TRINITY_DN29289_c0_g1~~TRINITY_DN29289_c0_g1_i1.p1  ORF type:complete len:276 (+),score=36.67 TRINITY_DN29289_c0_g1_i1:83-910(+)
MAEVVTIGAADAPAQMSMSSLPNDGVMVYQNTSQCCRCCCCQPNIDWTIHPYKADWGHEDQMQTLMFMKEDASWFGRCMSWCCPAGRATKYSVYAGDKATGQVLFTHEKGCTNSNCPIVMFSDNGPVRCPCCCCLPYLETKDASGKVIGKSQYVCDQCLFVPKYDLYDSTGKQIYRVRPETCCGGCCINCKCGGGQRGKCFRIPFPIRDPVTNEPVGDAAITDLWAGALHECCTNREMYALKFPQNADPKERENIQKTLIGMTLLIDITLNEQDQ